MFLLRVGWIDGRLCLALNTIPGSQKEVGVLHGLLSVQIVCTVNHSVRSDVTSLRLEFRSVRLVAELLRLYYAVSYSCVTCVRGSGQEGCLFVLLNAHRGT